MVLPASLKPNDKIAIVATARKVSSDEMSRAAEVLKGWGLEVVYGNNLYRHENQYAGSDAQRTEDLQNALNDDSIRTILFARGGYGTVRIIDKIDFSAFEKNPKWLIGFSDITVIHSHVHTNFGIQTVHGPMAINFPKAPAHVLDSLKNILFSAGHKIEAIHHQMNRRGKTKGILVGGNLSLLYALNGTDSDIDTKNKILFIEDLDEHLYHMDRMMMNLKRSGKLANLNGLIVGGMNDMRDNTKKFGFQTDNPFGKTAEEIISESVAEYDYPVSFNFPAGHIENNYPLILGSEIELNVGELTTVNFNNRVFA